MLTVPEILEKWANYSEYDPNQTAFNLLSLNYTFNHVGKHIEKLLNYDPVGSLAVIYAKDAFVSAMKEAKIEIFDLFSQPDFLKEEKEMWDIFMSEDVRQIEQHYLDGINDLIAKVVPTKMLGERNLEAEKKALFDSATTVTEELTKCNEELFLRGGPIQPITNISTHIHVFNRLSECLLALESAPDGMYLCFIKNYGTANCFFGFFVKSNGTILSVNERVDESYPGQHGNSRNGRWQEDKKFSLFPYDYIMEFDNFDYKGYSMTQVIDEEQLAFFKLPEKAYMPLILAMVMINSKYAGKDLSDMPVKLVDSLLPLNLSLPTPGIEALVVADNSLVAQGHKEYRTKLTSENVLAGAFHEHFNHGEDKSYRETGSFPVSSTPSTFYGASVSSANVFISLYGEGFELDASKLLMSDPHLKLLSPAELETTKDLPNPEFVGTENRFDLIAYMQARSQLAAHIRNKVYEEFLAFGGVEGLEKWWADALQRNRDHILDLCVQKYLGIQAGSEDNCKLGFRQSPDAKGLRYIDFFPEAKHGRPQDEWYYFHGEFPFNDTQLDKYGRENYGRFLCLNTGAKASLAFTIRPDNWVELEQVVGEVPRILKGWDRQGHNGYGNSLISVTDKVTEVGTPFEEHEQRANKRYSGIRARTDFNIGIAFSKRGWAQELKKHGIKC